MIAVLKHGTTEKQTQHLIDWLKRMQVDVHVSHGKEVTVLGLVGDTSRVDMELLGSLEIVEKWATMLGSAAAISSPSPAPALWKQKIRSLRLPPP